MIIREYECGCKITTKKHYSSIEYCSLHKAASDMYGALKEARNALTIKLDTPKYREILDFKSRVEPMILKALAKAEDK